MEEKKERRNKRIAVVSAILVLLVAILCLGGVTFAKYVSSTSAPSQQATVAKWGYVVTVTPENMFNDAYGDNGTSATWAEASTGRTGLSIAADTAKNNIVAPGAKGSMKITVTGQAEVAAKLSLTYDASTFEEISLTKPEDNTDPDNVIAAVDYKPIVWKVEKKNESTALYDGKSLSDALKALQNNLGTGVIMPGATALDLEYTISWEWKFDDTTATPDANKYDTILGNVAAGNTAPAGYTAKTTIKFAFSLAVEQSQTCATA